MHGVGEGVGVEPVSICYLKWVGHFGVSVCVYTVFL